MENELIIGMVQLDTNMKEEVAKRLIDQQISPLLTVKRVEIINIDGLVVSILVFL